jgi:hypothetical protein
MLAWYTGNSSRLRTAGFYVLVVVAASAFGALAGATPPGRISLLASYHFLLFYAGVIALFALSAAVAAGLIASDRIIMRPRGRVAAQAVHRAAALIAVAVLVVHIVLEIVVGRSAAADAVIPFLARTKTLYIAEGTIGADMVFVLLWSGLMRPRFALLEQKWAWRSIHVSAYVAWILSILHGLLGGRAARPYVDWDYGLCIAAVGLALVVRLAARIRPRTEAALPAALSLAADRAGAASWQAALAQAGLLGPADLPGEADPWDSRPLAASRHGRAGPAAGRRPRAAGGPARPGPYRDPGPEPDPGPDSAADPDSAAGPEPGPGSEPDPGPDPEPAAGPESPAGVLLTGGSREAADFPTAPIWRHEHRAGRL